MQKLWIKSLKKESSYLVKLKEILINILKVLLITLVIAIGIFIIYKIGIFNI